MFSSVECERSSLTYERSQLKGNETTDGENVLKKPLPHLGRRKDSFTQSMNKFKCLAN